MPQIGIYQRANAAAITDPVAYKTFLLDEETGELLVWTGAAWAIPGSYTRAEVDTLLSNLETTVSGDVAEVSGDLAGMIVSDIAAHVAADNPHPQYLSIADPSGFNGSFDRSTDGVPDGYTVGLYTSGDATLEVSGGVAGGPCETFTHPGGAGKGGGWIESGLLVLSAFVGQILSLGYKCSAAGTKVEVIFTFYDTAFSSLGSLTVYTSTANPTQWTCLLLTNLSIYTAAAKYVKIKLVGGLDDTDVAGSVSFAELRWHTATPPRQRIALTEAINFQTVGASGTNYSDIGGPYSITIPAWATTLIVPFHFTSVNSDNAIFARLRIGAAYSSVVSATSADYYGEAVMDVTALAGAQSLYIQTMYTPGSGGGYNVYSTDPLYKKSYRHQLRTVTVNDGRVVDTL